MTIPPSAAPISPERLARSLRPLGRGSWIGLAAIYAILGLLIGWGFLGSLPTYVQAEGILLNQGARMLDVRAPGSGVLTEIRIDVGDEVREGQPLATLLREQVRQQIANAELAAEEAARIRTELDTSIAATLAARAESALRRRRALQQQIESGRERETQIARRLTDEERLLSQGIATRQSVQQTRELRAQVQQQISGALAELAAVDQANAEFDAQSARERSQADRVLADARRALAELRSAEAETTRVLAPATGRVTEVRATDRMAVQQGQSLFGIEPVGEGLEARLFIPARQGKMVVPGMAVRLEPSTAPREEFGAVLAEITWVSAFPATLEGMRAVLQNDELARGFARGGPPFAARARLLPDAATTSGYRWTSDRAQDLPLTSGTTIQATVVVRRQPPITLLIPLLGSRLGLL